MRWHLDPSVKEVHLTHDDLVSVLTNLIVNAADALDAKPGGRIDVSLERSGTTAVLKVKDNGCGIAPETWPVCWTRFSPPSPPARAPGWG